MRYVEAPAVFDGGGPAVFLAGGITGVRDWQADAVQLLTGLPVTLLNPRRARWPEGPGPVAEAQIRWEYEHLNRASQVLFWFSSETIQPIALYELGRMAATGKPLAVGADPDYRRRFDVVIQMDCARPGLTVHDTLEATCAEAARLIPGA